jgi:hypothetical protein
VQKKNHTHEKKPTNKQKQKNAWDTSN